MLRVDERGAVLAEFSLVVPLLLMMLLGIISAGVALDRNQAMTYSAREASRFGATLPVVTTTAAWLDSVASVAAHSANGNLDSNVPGRSLCIALIRGTSVNRRLENASGIVYDEAPCFSDGFSHSRVQVIARRETEFGAVFFSSTLTLNRRTTSRYEASP